MPRRLTCLLLTVLCLAGCDSKSELSPRERALLLDASDFHLPDAGNGSYSKSVNYLTRSIDLQYEYHSPSSNKLFYLNSTVSLQANGAEALVNGYAALKGAIVALDISGAKIVREQLPLTRELGSHAELLLLRVDGQPIGNMFVVSIGKKVLFCVFTGRYYESAEAFEAFIAPKLALLKAHDHDEPLVAWGKGLFDGED